MTDKRFKAAGYAIFSVAVGTLLMRIIMYFAYDAIAATNLSGPMQELLLDLLFTFPVQVLFCFLIPFFIYKRYQKLPYKEVFIQSNFKKTDWQTILLSVGLGAGALFLTVVISSLWRGILIMSGYNYSSQAGEFSQTFNIGYFLAALFLTAVLPAFCEEFALRGSFLTVLKNSFLGQTVIILMAVAFGLFHQNITQVFYTAIFGGFMAFLVIKTESIFPAMVVHFVNNGLATILDYADHYKWGNGFVDKLFTMIGSYGLVSMVITAALSTGLIILLMRIIIKRSKKNKPQTVITSLYKPALRESAFYIGAICLTALTTVFSFLFRY